MYDNDGNRFSRCDKGHDGIITYAALTSDNKMLVSLGMDGYANVYKYHTNE